MEPSYVLTDGLVKALQEAFATADIAALLRLHDELDKNVEGRATPKAPQDMDLRELFDHVAIVNDAIRAALLTHPGMGPDEREGR